MAWEVELLGTGGTHRLSFCPNPIHGFCLGHGRQQILSPSVLSSLTDKCWVTSSYLWSSHILSSRQLYRPLWMLWVSPTLSFYLCMRTISQALSSRDPVSVSPEWARLGKLVHLISKRLRHALSSTIGEEVAGSCFGKPGGGKSCIIIQSSVTIKYNISIKAMSDLPLESQAWGRAK